MNATPTSEPSHAQPSGNATYRRGAVLDAKVREIAQQVATGDCDERQARWNIATLVYQAELAASVAGRFKHRSPKRQDVQDLAERFTDLLTVKIVGDEARAPALDIDRIAEGGSISAWVSKFGASSMLSIQRDLARSTRRNGAPYSPIPEADTGRSEGRITPLELIALRDGAGTYTDASTDDVAERSAFEIAAASFLAHKRNARSVRLTHCRALAFCEGYHVPAPERIATAATAERVRAVLHADPRAAATAVRSLLDPAQARDDVDADLVRMWQDQPKEILELLASVDHRVVREISLAAATPAPPLGEKILTELRRECAGAARVKRGSDAHSALNAAITAWAASVSGMRMSEYHPGVGDPMAPSNLKTAADQAKDRRRFEHAVATLADLDVTALGTSADAVDAYLRGRVAALDDAQVLDRAV